MKNDPRERNERLFLLFGVTGRHSQTRLETRKVTFQKLKRRERKTHQKEEEEKEEKN